MTKYLWKIEKTYSSQGIHDVDEYSILDYDNNIIQSGFTYNYKDKIENVAKKHNKLIIELLEKMGE